METKQKPKNKIIIIILVLFIFLGLFFILTKCGKESEKEDETLLVVESEEEASKREYNDVGIPVTYCFNKAELKISDSAGFPKEFSKASALYKPEITLEESKPIVASMQNLIIPPIFLEKKASEDIKVIFPTAKEQLIAGSNMIVYWTVDSGRTFTAKISLTVDGKVAQVLKENITTQGYGEVKIPDIVSEKAKIRVDLYIYDNHFGYNESESFEVYKPEKEKNRFYLKVL